MRRVVRRKPAKRLASKRQRRTIEALEDRRVLDSALVFNEIMYNPSGPVDDELEWIELHNQMFVDLDISNWSIENGVNFTFPEGTIVREQGYVVIAANPEAWRQASGIENALGPFLGRLDNRGEQLRLINNNGRLMNQVDYRDRGDWPSAPDGSGSSLAKFSPSSASHIAANWTFSAQPGGTPGAVNFVSPGALITDVLLPEHSLARAFVPRSGDLENQWIETDFDDSDWTVGMTGVGFDARSDYDRFLGLDLDSPPDGQAPIPMIDVNRSVYVRIPFDIGSDPREYSSVKMRLRYEDGFVAYINGVEVAHANAPGRDGNESELTWFSSATRTHSDILARTPETFDLTQHRDVLRPGRNVLAIHGLNRELTGRTADFLLLPELLGNRVVTAAPTSPLVFNEIAAADDDSFFIEIANDGPESVDVGGIVLATIGQTANEYVLPSQVLEPQGLMAVNAQQLGSRPAENDLLVLFASGKDAVIDGRHVTGRLRGRSDAHLGDWLFPNSATPAMPNSFHINDRIVINEIMYHGPTTAALQGQEPVYRSTTIVPMDSTWRYSKDFSLGAADPPYDPGPNWEDTAHAVGFPNWSEGQAPIGFASRRPEIRINHSLISPRASPEPIITYYFELEFGITDQQLDQFDDLVIEHLIDDGAVFYINGQEVERFRMPDGVPNANTLARVNAVDRIIVRESNGISKDSLVVLPAMNRISVEVHQGAIDSGDVAFGLELQGRKQRVPATDDAPAIESTEEWLELYNRSQTESVDLGGWSFRHGMDYKFAENTIMTPGQYLVLAKDPEALLATHPDLAPAIVLGPYTGNLANAGEFLELRDAFNNPVDRLHYYDRGRWHHFADGGRSSLELIDPDSDNAIPESWAASNETGRSQWTTYSYFGTATNLGIDPDLYNEFLFGLLGAGEFLMDDVSVIENPGTANSRQVIQNGTFQADTIGGPPDKWRVIGNHHGTVVADPDDPANQVLHVVATGPTEHMHNNSGTTLKAGNEFIRIDGEATYEFSFRAKWLAGSNQLHTRLYFNRLARKHLLEVPDKIGTPGTANSVFAENIGPTFSDLRHRPAVPDVNEVVTVTIAAADPEGVAHMTLWYSVNENDFVGVPMSFSDGKYAARIPGQQQSDLIQFYVSGTDGVGAVSTFPAAGTDSRAMYKVQDGRAKLDNVLNFRIVMTETDVNFLHQTTNVMSNDRLRATVIFNEQEVYYDVGVRLKGAERIRSNNYRVGYTVQFDPGNLYRGVQDTVRIDRNGGGGIFQQKEMLVKHAIQHAGDIPGMYDDLVLVISPLLASDPNSAVSGMMLMTAYGDAFLDSQYENGSEGNGYEYELIYFPQTTVIRNDRESLKVPTPDGTARVNLQLVQGFEDNLEAYRWHFLHDNNRGRDEFDQLIAALGAIGQPSSEEFHRATHELIDVDQWLRAFAIITLFGVGDNYGTGAQHNVSFYFRPSDGRMLFFPWDMDFAFNQAATSGIVSNNDLRKFLTDSNNEHAYYGHLNDMITTTFNNEYLDRWIDHYSDKVTQPFPSFKTYVSQRVDSVTQDCGQLNSCLPSKVDFEIATNGPLDVGNDSTANITGSGWVDVREIRLAGSPLPLDVNWTRVTQWEVNVPVSQASSELTLVAYDFQGNPIDTASIVVRSTAANPLAEFLRITEIHFNPATPTDSEMASLPGVSNEDFEFIEVQNVGAETVHLEGASFTDGISFRFPATQLSPGQFGVIVGNEPAFRLRYGSDIAILGQYELNLRNGGERITVAELDGTVIQDFAYNDWYLDTDGLGASLAVADTRGNYDEPTNWRPSVAAGGSPGSAEPLVPQPGDGNYDRQFNQLDLVLAQQGGKYLSGIRATWQEGDWNGDGIFDPRDLVAALQTGAYSSAGQAAASHLASIEQVFTELDQRAHLNRKLRF